MDRTFKVVSKGLFGKNKDKPMLKLSNEDGEAMSIRLPVKTQLKDYPIETVLTVRIVQEQKTIA